MASSSTVSVKLMAPELLPEVHALLREAYGHLAATKGVSYWAAYQDELITRKRCAKGETYVAYDGDNLVGTITLYDPIHADCPFYERPGVTSFGMFGVKPDVQRGGVGALLLDTIEARAREQGRTHLALDTAEHAQWSVAYYARRGYEMTGEYVRWERDSFRSVIMAKRL